jgi:aminopeptidase N
MLLCGPLLNAQFTHADSLRGFLYPERSCYDVAYYNINLEVDPATKSLKGSVAISFKAMEEFNRMQVDLYPELNVESITDDQGDLKWTREGAAIYVDLPHYLVFGSLKTITVRYSGIPREAENAPWGGGFVWTQDAEGKPWVGVACEGDGASLWWPCKDHPSDEADSVRITVTVPGDLTAVCNGRLEAAARLVEKTSYTWFVSNPINSYNVTVNIADYAYFSDTIKGVSGPLTLDYYVLRANLEKAKKQFQQVEPMMHCFEQHFGPYPFYEDGYKLVETPYLGMEHQSAIAYGNHYMKGYLGMDLSGKGFDYIIIHESGHEWFGNSITADDMAELWIHESFTTYSEAIYLECMYGLQTAVNYLRAQRSSISNSEPIVGPRGVAFDNFEDTDMYYKGAWILHTLRSVVNNDTLWFNMLRDFCAAYYHEIISTQEVIRFFCDRSAMNLEPIFRHYLYSAERPVFEYKLMKKGRMAKYRWNNVSADFNMPVEVGYSGATTEVIRITPTTEWQTLTVPGKRIETLMVNGARFYVASRL